MNRIRSGRDEERDCARECNTRPEVPAQDTPGGIAPLREVLIQPVENGFIVRVGCKTFVSQVWEEVAGALRIYWRDPEQAQKLFCKQL